MCMNKLQQNGFAHVALIMIVVVLAAITAVGYTVFTKQNNSKDTSTTENLRSNDGQSSGETQPSNKTAEVKIKNLGINLDYYDEATNRAGDLQFSKAMFASGMQRLFFEYGHEVPASSAGPAKKNPQPTFIAPLGTKVMSLVDGEVVNVPQLYSNDYSIHVQAPGSELIFETEHVINVLVKKGDTVKAGQVIAEVSDYDAKNYDGLGLFEIGILKGGNPPSHVCPFDYLDDSIKDETFKQIEALQKSWETYRGDNTIYDEAKAIVPGCVSRDPIEG